MNHTRFPKEDHLPDCASRDNQVKNGDRVERINEGNAKIRICILNVVQKISYIFVPVIVFCYCVLQDHRLCHIGWHKLRFNDPVLAEK